MNVQDTLYQQVSDIAAALSLPVKFPNYNAPTSGEYIEVIHVPNGAARELLGVNNNGQGLLRLAFHGVVDVGEERADTVLQSFKTGFDKGTRLFGTGIIVTIYLEPQFMTVQEDGQGTVFGLSIRYRF